MTLINDSNNNYAEFGTFKRTTASHKSKPQGKINILSNLEKLHEFYDERGLEFDENIFEKIIEEYLLDD